MADMGETILKFFGFLIILMFLLVMIIPALIIFIINFVKGIKNKWPTNNLVTVIVTGTLILLLLIIIILFVGASINQAIDTSYFKTSSTESIALFLSTLF